jgi:hypothetical protein
MIEVAKRVHLTLPDTVHADLEAWANMRDQKVATVAAIAIEMYLESLKARGEIPLSQNSPKTEDDRN